MFDDCCPLFSFQDRDRYLRYRAQSQTELADASFDARWSWHEGFDYRVAELADCLFFVSDGGVFTTPHLTLPLGPLDQGRLQTIIDAVAPEFDRLGWPVRVLYIDACYVPLFENLQGYRVKIGYDRSFSDYLYEAQSLRQLSGKDLHAKRNHFNRFLRTYPRHEFSPLTSADTEEALQLVLEWCKEKGTDCSDITQSDYRPIKMLLDYFDELQLRGGAIRIDGQLVAFSIASEPWNQTGIIHVEKARAEYPGLYAAINKMTLDTILPEVLYVNREEDLGIPGLRKAKLSYGPCRLIHKYEAILTHGDP
jgi:hypothetical protein